MFVINPQDKVVYAGDIDSKPSTNPDDIKTATNYVAQALDESMAGKAVSKLRSKAYGNSSSSMTVTLTPLGALSEHRCSGWRPTSNSSAA